MTQDLVTQWSLVPLPGAVSAASYVTGPLAAQYRLIVDILDDHRAVSLTGVGFDELQSLIFDRLPADRATELLADLPLESRMRQLVDWGTCEAWQDKAETQEDFLRNRHRYQLTEAGSAINRAVRRMEEDLGTSSTAVLLAPSTISTRLTAMLDALAAQDSPRASQEFAQVQTTLDAMAAAAAEWQSRLATALGGSPSESKVTRLLETILAYVDAWGSGVDAWSEQIASALPVLESVADDVWRAIGLDRLGSEATDSALAAAVQEYRDAVATLTTWFAGPTPQARHLRRQIRDAVTPVLRSHRTLLAVGGTVSRKVDLLRLAAAIEAADDEAAAWELWCNATGLFSAKHFITPTPEVTAGHRTSVWDSPPAAISRRLRTQAARSLSGRSSRIVDTSAARAEARRIAAREQADLESAGATLMARSGTLLSDWPSLDSTETSLFLELVSIARDHPAANGTLIGTSPDGRWRLELHQREGTAVLTTPEGRLAMPDALVEFTA